MNCTTCKHWKPLALFLLNDKGLAPTAETLTDADKCGECRRSPPAVASGRAGGWRAFPITRSTDGCGEWSASSTVAYSGLPPGSFVEINPRPKKKPVDKPGT